jgi:DNA-binding response OmpR family regulator
MLHILLVEDNPADVLMVREGIRMASVKADVLIAYDGEQALRFLTEFNFKPDFILLDLNLPKFNGFAILQQYRAHGGPPIIVLTGSENPADRARAMELGVSEYIIKPTSFEAFIEAVRDAVDRWGKNTAAANAGKKP